MFNLNSRPKYVQNLAKFMKLKNMSDASIEAYSYAIMRLSNTLGKHPSKITLKEILDYLHDMINSGDYAFDTYKQNVCGIRYYYRHIGKKSWEIERIPYPKQEEQIRVILSREEVIRLLSNITNDKIQLMAIIAYACGLRHSEIRNLTVKDIDRERMKILIRKGKGKKCREVQLPPELLTRIVNYYRKYQNKINSHFFLVRKAI